jgi:DNA repair protein RecO (recombination protein O)
MPSRESEAIVLRTYPLGEGDRLVSFLSRTDGRLRGVARGARKPKSRFGASLELLSYIRIWFYAKETRQLVRISQCELIESFLDAQRSYNASVAFSLLAEIAEGVLPEGEPSDPAFRLLLATCRAMAQTGSIALPVSYFVLWMLRLGGWLPSLSHCAACRRDIREERVWAAEDGSGIFCQECRRPEMRPVSVESLLAARAMLREPLERLAGAKQVSPGLTNYLLDLIERHMERKSGVRPMLELTP